MMYGAVPLEKRMKEHIREYQLENLFSMDFLKDYLESLAKILHIDMLLTGRHGEKAVVIGNFDSFEPDVVNEPGIKLRVENRTVGHFYCRLEGLSPEEKKNAELLLNNTILFLSMLGEKTYLYRETSIYLEEQLVQKEAEALQAKNHEREDVLTGVYNKSYYENRMHVLERSGIAPVAVINANINDWKFANDNFGYEESDRLIRIIAGILKEEARPEYIIGRTEGDVFSILIPMAEAEEAEDYCRRVQESCLRYEDVQLAPSVAMGYVMKTNVEEPIAELMSDAEYEMFNDKFKLKQAEGYQDRLRKGLT